MKVLLVASVVGTLVLGLAALGVYLAHALYEDKIARAYSDTDVPTDAAPASDEPVPVPVRARTAGPALRVHLCASCGTHGVPRPGEWCMPCVYRTSPVHRAEEILAEAARKADAS